MGKQGRDGHRPARGLEEEGDNRDSGKEVWFILEQYREY